MQNQRLIQIFVVDETEEIVYNNSVETQTVATTRHIQTLHEVKTSNSA